MVLTWMPRVSSGGVHDTSGRTPPAIPVRGAHLCAGLTQLKRLHDSLNDLFQLSQSHHSLCRRFHRVDNILETSLLFVDAHGSFCSALVGLKEAQLAAQVAIRRHDSSKISSYR
ncbi:hypothetical protein MRB53_013269 [Persea americana]|uniref:Uncharacterized protein n=1 Tax=Persea americana TaxID=3435 RepID=A0ACC2K852_PERAE|nr:hypothetical protein MRB53_013269 [Persea americana]